MAAIIPVAYNIQIHYVKEIQFHQKLSPSLLPSHYRFGKTSAYQKKIDEIYEDVE